MKLLVLCVLLPCIIAGSTTESWEDEEDQSFTLKAETSPPIQEVPDKKLVKIDLSGPDTITSSPKPEADLFPMMLRKLMENGFNNEIEDKNTKSEVKTPLTFMTPPPELKKDSKEELDNESFQGNSQSLQDESKTRTTSGEFDDGEESSTALPSKSEDDGANEPADPTPSKYGQYADQYQNYLPKQERINNQEQYPYDKEEDASKENDEEEFPTTSSTMMQPTPGNHMDRVTFGESSNEFDEKTNQVTDQDPSNDIDQTRLNRKVNGEPEVTSQPAQTPTVYYVLLRPRLYNTRMASDYNAGMRPPTPFTQNNDYWHAYSQNRMLYRYPSYIAQDYDDQTPSQKQTYSPYLASPFNVRPYDNTMMTRAFYPYQTPQYSAFSYNRPMSTLNPMYLSQNSYSPYYNPSAFYRYVRTPSVSASPENLEASSSNYLPSYDYYNYNGQIGARSFMTPVGYNNYRTLQNMAQEYYA